MATRPYLIPIPRSRRLGRTCRLQERPPGPIDPPVHDPVPNPPPPQPDLPPPGTPPGPIDPPPLPERDPPSRPEPIDPPLHTTPHRAFVSSATRAPTSPRGSKRYDRNGSGLTVTDVLSEREEGRHD